MAKRVQQIIKGLPGPREVLSIPSLALKSVTSKTGLGVYASSDTLFKGAVFGRDSLEVAEDLLYLKPRLVRTILFTLAALQGQAQNDLNEEEPGKIVHEYRATVVDGKRIDHTSMEIFQRLSQKWGGNEHEMAYYGSIDATPHFLRTLGAYAHVYGYGVLDRTVHRHDGHPTTMREVAHAATQWLLRALDASRSGLLEYQRRNPAGMSNQVWKDSDEFYVHENKERANHEAPIASIEVQGLAYDALMAAAMFDHERAEAYRQRAYQLRDRTIELLWQEDRREFALGLDYDPADAHLRLIRTSTANPAALLDSGFFDDLPDELREKYVTAIVERIMSGDFLTDAGIRSRALSAARVVGFWDYHGSFVTWPKETHDIARGMRRQGLPKLARQLENRILNVVLKSRQYPEFVYVDAQGRVLASSPSAHSHGDVIVIDGPIKPERVQAWTVSAVMAIMAKRRIVMHFRRASQPAPPAPWRQELERRILASIHKVEIYINPFALSARYPTYKYRLSDRDPK